MLPGGFFRRLASVREALWALEPGSGLRGGGDIRSRSTCPEGGRCVLGLVWGLVPPGASFLSVSSQVGSVAAVPV